MSIIGNKNNLNLFDNLIKRNIPNDILYKTYIEPFGGSFGLSKLLNNKNNLKERIYNDLNKYENEKLNIIADKIYHLDYTKIIDMYNNENSFFYLDPPYINKEKYYEVTFNNINDHYKLSEKIKEIKGKWLLSYQEHPLLNEWYSEYYFDKYDGNSMYHKKEIIIRNYII